MKAALHSLQKKTGSVSILRRKRMRDATEFVVSLTLWGSTILAALLSCYVLA